MIARRPSRWTASVGQDATNGGGKLHDEKSPLLSVTIHSFRGPGIYDRVDLEEEVLRGEML